MAGKTAFQLIISSSHHLPTFSQVAKSNHSEMLPVLPSIPNLGDGWIQLRRKEPEQPLCIDFPSLHFTIVNHIAITLLTFLSFSPPLSSRNSGKKSAFPGVSFMFIHSMWPQAKSWMGHRLSNINATICWKKKNKMHQEEKKNKHIYAKLIFLFPLSTRILERTF